MKRLVPVVLAALLASPLPSAPAAAAPECFGRAATIVGTDGDDDIEGTSDRDVIFSGGGRDEVQGLGGDDLICGGAMIDHLRGGAGDDALEGGPGSADDWLFGDEGADRLHPGCSHEEGDLLEGGGGPDRLIGSLCGQATMVPGAGDDFVRATGGEIAFPGAPGAIHVDLTEGVATGEGRDRIEIVQPPRDSGIRVATVVGTDFDDELIGGALSDSFQGGAGDDVIEGRRGADSLDGFAGSDTLRGGRGADFFQVYDGTTARGGPGDDVVVCEPRFEHESAEFSGGSGEDWVALLGLPGEAVVDLSAGTAVCSYTYESMPPSTVAMELLLTGVENVDADRARVDVTGSEERNVIVGGPKNDVVRGGGGADEIDGGAGRDDIRGGAGDDRLLGGTFGDDLFGDAGDDVLDGEEGVDSVDGGGGRDRCSGETRTSCEES